MAVHTFDEFCELEERAARNRRSRLFSEYEDDDSAGHDSYEDESTGFAAVEDMLRESGDLEEIY